jgi:hypothetical protein
MQKVVNVFIAVLLIAFIGACAGTGKELTPPNLNTTIDGDTTWTSSFFSGTVKIDESFKYVGITDKSDAKAHRYYHVWKRDSGQIIFIVDFSVKTGWTFPDDYDPGLGREQSPNEKGIISHKSMEYTVWNEMYKKPYAVMNKLGVKVPQCKLLIQTGRFSPSRKSAYFFVLIEESPCGSTDMGSLLDNTRAWITLM